MFKFSPDKYESPFVLASEGMRRPGVISTSRDFIFNDGVAMALICSSQFVGTQIEGHVLVVPAEPYENIFDIPDAVLHRTVSLVKQVAFAMKLEYHCDGITVWQNNGPASGQDVWHYHTHVIPRFDGDNYFVLLNNLDKSFRTLEAEKREAYANRLRDRLATLL